MRSGPSTTIAIIAISSSSQPPIPKMSMYRRAARGSGHGCGRCQLGAQRGQVVGD